MTDLVARLREAIDAEEARLHALPPFPWRVCEDELDVVMAADDWTVAEAVALSSNQQRLVAAHIARHDPAAVLRRCAADRKLLDWLVTCEGKALDNNWWSLDVNAAIELLAEAYGVEA